MHHSLKYLTAASLATALAACGSDSSEETGIVSFGLTDAPTNEFEQVWITYTSMSLKPADGDAIVFEFDEPKTLDMLTLQNGQTAVLLDEEEVPAGRYNWIRLNVDQDELFVVEKDGGERTLFVPSGELKLVSGFTIAADSTTNFTVDFDVRKAIVNPQGSQPGDYFLKPALRLVDNLEVGSIAGTVDASTVIQTECADSNTYAGIVYVFEGAGATPDDLGSDGEPLVTVPVSDENNPGTFTYNAPFLIEGEYTVSYSCDADDNEVDEDLTFVGTQDVTVVAGGESTANIPQE